MSTKGKKKVAWGLHGFRSWRPEKARTRKFPGGRRVLYVCVDYRTWVYFLLNLSFFSLTFINPKIFPGQLDTNLSLSGEVSELELCTLEVKMALARVYTHMGKSVPIKLMWQTSQGPPTPLPYFVVASKPLGPISAQQSDMKTLWTFEIAAVMDGEGK